MASASEAAAPTRREDARILRSRDALRSALLNLIETRPFDAITIREITDAANVGYATFYRHYPTKTALLDDVAAAQIRHLIDRAMPLFSEGNTLESCLAQFRYVDAHRSMWRALLTGGAAATVREEIIQISREVALAYGETEGWLPADLSFRFVASATVELLTWWLERADRVPAGQGAELLNRLVIAPVVRSRSREKAG